MLEIVPSLCVLMRPGCGQQMGCSGQLWVAARHSVLAEGGLRRVLGNSCRCGIAGAGPITRRHGSAAPRRAKRQAGLSTRFHVRCARGQLGRLDAGTHGQIGQLGLRAACGMLCWRRKVELKMRCVARLGGLVASLGLGA